MTTYGKMLETVVHALGKVEGFGAVMDCAAQLWAETDPVGALTVGPARGMRRMGDGPKYRKKPVVIEATQWFQNGDHPDDACYLISPTGRDYQYAHNPAPFMSEGKVVRYFRRPDVPADRICKECGGFMQVHGWIDTKEGGHIVCPSDWIITGVKGERYPCKPDIFAATYEAVE